MVLGMSVVNGDGVVRKCGGKVVKNVTGYDLAKLYIGSLGTLGVVSEVTFKLRPLPIARREWSYCVDDYAQGIHLLEKNDGVHFASGVDLSLVRTGRRQGRAMEFNCRGSGNRN